MNIYICDNNPLHMQHTSRWISGYLKQKPSVDFQCIELFPERLDELLSKKTFSAEIIVLDIQMQWKNGIELAAQINQVSPRCQIIFLTAYIDYATMVYETKHIYFVLKTQMEEMMPKAVDKALKALNVEEPCLAVNLPALNIRIPLAKFFSLRKISIIRQSGQKYKSLPFRKVSGSLRRCLVLGFCDVMEATS